MAPRTDAVRVLVVDPSDRGGLARYTEVLVDELRGQGVTTFRASPGGLGDRDLELRVRRWGPEVEALGRARLSALRFRELLPTIRSLRRAVLVSKPDIVHFQAEVVPGVDALVLGCIRRRAAVVLTVHDPESMQGPADVLSGEKRRWRRADAVIVHSERSRDLVADLVPEVPVHLVPVDLKLAKTVVPRSEARRRLDLGMQPLALVLGFLRPYKGFALLAAAWPAVARAIPEARLMLVGEAYPSQELDRLCRLDGVELRPGFLSEDEVDFWAAAADVLVMPYDRGSHSGVLHRAIAAATPILASPPLAEEVERTKAGRVVVLEPALWSDAMVGALGASPLPAPEVQESHQTATDTCAVYREVLDRRLRSGRGSGR